MLGGVRRRGKRDDPQRDRLHTLACNRPQVAPPAADKRKMSTAPIAAVQAASSFEVGTVQSVAAMKVMRMALQQQEQSAAQLLQAVPTPQLATSGSVGTQLHVVG